MLDGCWIEGCIEGVASRAIGVEGGPPERNGALLLDKLEQVVLPLCHVDQAGWRRVTTGLSPRVIKLGGADRLARMVRDASAGGA